MEKKGTWLEIKLNSGYLMKKIISQTKVLRISDRPHFPRMYKIDFVNA